jgi:hypothetical protein
VFVPNSCAHIGNGAFFGIGAEIIEFEAHSSLTELSDHIFKDCVSVKKITIPPTVKSIGISAFCGCTTLENLSIPESVEHIAGYAFCGCSSLKELVIPSRRLESDSKAFEGFSGKVDIVLLRPGVQVQPPPLRSDDQSQSGGDG